MFLQCVSLYSLFWAAARSVWHIIVRPLLIYTSRCCQGINSMSLPDEGLSKSQVNGLETNKMREIECWWPLKNTCMTCTNEIKRVLCRETPAQGWRDDGTGQYQICCWPHPVSYRSICTQKHLSIDSVAAVWMWWRCGRPVKWHIESVWFQRYRI